jgi:3-deoxy-D-manno-octulosonate 8-phosphate phosphatase (KDO 8-P phosphatase)
VTIDDRARAVKLILLDVDGVLTDGTVIVHGDGTESKGFHIRDGAAMVWAGQSGIPVGLLSARSSAATAQRAAQLGIKIVSQGVADKAQEFGRLAAAAGVAEDAIAYMGDDLLDLPVFARAGLAAAPADAADDVRTRAHWVSTLPGGRGAVRQLVEMILRAQGRWDSLLSTYSS